MQAVSSWNFTPYAPLDRPERMTDPYICRVVPGRNEIRLDYLDRGAKPKTEHTLFWRIRGEGDFTAVPVEDGHAQLCGLKSRADYEFYISRNEDGAKSDVRLAQTGVVPGTVVNYLHPEDDTYAFSGRYLCSPSLIRLPSGRLLSSMDVFEGGKAQNLTLLFASEDDGATWSYVTELFPCFWGQLFWMNGRLYLLGVSDEYGDLLIGASDNEGRDWTNPTVLFRGSSSCVERGLHRAPMRFCHAKGRIWTDVEYGAWAKHEMNNAVLSAPDDCEDYTDPAVWTLSTFWRHADAVAEGAPLDPACAGGIEGNVVEAPDGTLVNFLRYADRTCLVLRIDTENPDAAPSFDRLVHPEITASKFDLVRDPDTGDYFALCSRALDEPETKRNLLSLFRSPDLEHWRCVADVLDARAADPAVVGFQYVSFLIEGDDLLFLSRTAFGKPHNYHDSNYQTFHRLRNFRDLQGNDV